ncbi:MAG: 23S rRNA (pseudouridine(1915)-N(3))-methyltransferase RlmH [Chlamydiae bacterium]|nr:23S rRNA (pseudouridine(1915)-N(3))-methyltransferase RlmH [Chlamydiota bacterium]
MQKIKIITVGKTKESWLQDAIEEYHKRLKNSITIEWTLAKDTEQLISLARRESYLISLDPLGRQHTSEEFSDFLHSHLVKSGSRLAIIIGGAEGIPEILKQKSQSLISLSKMTFTHQITRLIIIEQIYRSFEIQKASGYHK